jgi:uncharacterized protein (PEP-CTERM system associated)
VPTLPLHGETRRVSPAGLAACEAKSAHRQTHRLTGVSRGCLLAGLAGGLAAFSAAPLWAQDGAATPTAPAVTQTRSFSITPSFNASTAYAVSSARSDGELVTQVGPGLQINSRTGRLVGSLDYSLLGTLYSRNSDANTFTNSLAATAKGELVPRWAYVDVRANIAKQSVSAFGTQSTADSLQANNNFREVWTLYVSPYVRGELRDIASYEVRTSAGVNNVRGSQLGDSTNFGSSITLQSARRGTTLGWGLQGTAQRVDYTAGRATDTLRGTASLTYQPNADLLLTLRGGQESTNVGGSDRRLYANWGAGVRWIPGVRTTVSFDADRRYFGDSYQVLLEHRFRRSSVRFTSSRDASSSSDLTGVGQPSTLLQLLMRQYQSIEPDPVLREIRVRELLRLRNQNPNTIVGGGFATSGISLSQRNDLAYSYIGLRSDFTLLAFTSDSRSLDNFGAPLNAAGLGDTRQQGLLATGTHRLSPRDTLTLSFSYQRTLAEQGQAGNSLSSVNLGYTTLVSRSATASIGARYSIFDGALPTNREAGLTASLSVRF